MNFPVSRKQKVVSLALLLCCTGALVYQIFLHAKRASAATQAQAAQPGPASPDGVWQELSRTPQARTLRLNSATLVRLLNRAPLEYSAPLSASAAVLTLPLPDGTFGRFQIEESPTMEPALAAKYPDIKSYRAAGLDDRTATARCDVSPLGFHALVLGASGSVSIRPAGTQDTTTYISISGESEVGQAQCAVRTTNLDAGPRAPSPAVAISSRKNYRMAIATTIEYTANYGGAAAALATVNTWVNGANVVFERDIGAHFNLVANNNLIIFTASDNLTNDDESAMLNQIAPILDAIIGNANYDIGHVLGLHSTPGSSAGVASLASVCSGTLKGKGATRVSGAAGNGSAQGVLTHEFGHQFNANHSFNGTVNFCNQKNNATSWESGGGSTLMSYTGICQTDNITSTRDLRFHSGSYGEAQAWLASGTGGSCGTLVAPFNTAPTINSGGNFTIPQRTPFTLTAVGNDADPTDVPNLTYTWEQLDAGGAMFPQNGTPASYTDEFDPTNATTRPIFRAFPPTASPARTFPSMTYILNNMNVPPNTVGGFQTAEQLPRRDRTLNFRATVRDNRGGVNEADAVITVATSGPFAVTSPNSGNNVTGGAATNVTWSVNGTNAQAANVKISLSTDGGNTFPTVLADSTPNDATHSIMFPNGILTTTARIKIEAVGNIFFDISDAFNIAPGDGCPVISGINPQIGNPGNLVTLTGINFTGVTSVKFSNNVDATFNILNNTTMTTTVPVGAATGPITISKPGCTPVQTTAFTVCSGAPTTLSVDDNFHETGFGNGAGAIYVNRLTPGGANYPATLSQVSIYFGTFTGVTVGTPITIFIGANSGGGTNINGTTFQTVSATVNTLDTRNVYNVPPLTINAGDFVIGFSTTDGAPSIAVLDTSSNQGRSYVSTDNGATFTLSGNLAPPRPGNLGIRGVYLTGCGGGAPACPTVNNINPTNGLVGSQVVITGTNFTGVTGVKFSNNVTATINNNTGTQLTVTVPAGAITGPITISKTGCTDVLTADFTVNTPPACPTVTNINPTNGLVGSQVVITGTNFTGVTGVKFSNNVTATINNNTGTQLTVTVPVGAVTGPITISKTGCTDVNTGTFTVNTGCPAITITPPTLPAGTVNTAYNQAIMATGGTAPYTFSLTAGNPVETRFNATGPVAIPDNTPAGVDLPVTVTGIVAPITKVTVSLHLTHTFDGDLALQLIGPDATTVNLSTNRGNDSDNYGTACNPDAQRTLFDDAAATAIAAGTAPFVGSFRPEQVLSAFNGKSGAAVNGAWKLHVVDNALQDTGAIQCVSIFITQTLPAPGLSLAANGTLAGTPTTAGMFDFTVKATDANNCMGTLAYTLTINPAAACPTVTNLNPTSGLVGSSVTITGTNFTGVTAVKFSNNVNATITNNTGTQLTVTVPAGAVTGPITISKTGCTDVQTGSFTVTCPTITVNPAVLNPGTAGMPFTQIYTRTGGTAPITWSQTGTLPNGISFTPATATLAGTPIQFGTFPITVTATDANNCAGMRSHNLMICPAITLLPATLPAGLVGTPYTTTQLTATGGTGPYTFQAIAGTVPPGLMLTAGGLLSGTPTQQFGVNLTIQATDANGCTGTRTYDLQISCATITLNPTTLPAGTVGVPYTTTQLMATGGTAPYTFQAIAGSVPPGLTLTTGGLLSGTPTQQFGVNLEIRATDFNGCFVSRIYDLQINPPTGGNGLQFFPLPRPVRLLDTRAGQGNCDNVGTPIAADTAITTQARINCEGIPIPASAQAIVGNITVINGTGLSGFLTLYPAGQPLPLAANMIYEPGQVLSNAFTVGLSATGEFNIYGQRTIDVVVDVSGYFAPPGAGGLYYHTLARPLRLLDTRAGQGNCDNVGTPIAADTSITTQARVSCEGLTIPAAAQAIVGNITVINGTAQSGFLTLYPGGQPLPLAANLIYKPGQVLSNAFTVGLSATGQFNIYGQRTIDVVVDVAGYYSTEATDANGPGLLFSPLSRPVRLLDTRAGQGNCDNVGTPIAADTSITTQARITCEGIPIPVTAQTVLGNITVINGTAQSGFLTLYPAGLPLPLAANLIYAPGQVLSNAFTVGLSAAGEFNVYGQRTIDVVVDVSGYFAP